jgi:hypothetical protein
LMLVAIDIYSSSNFSSSGDKILSKTVELS